MRSCAQIKLSAKGKFSAYPECETRCMTWCGENMASNGTTGLVAGAIAMAIAGAAAGQTLTSARTAAAPVLDGAGGAEWAAAEPISVAVNLLPYKPNNGYEGITASTVTLRAMHDDANLYMLIEWDDPT